MLSALAHLGANDPAAERDAVQMWKAVHPAQAVVYSAGLPVGAVVGVVGALYAAGGNKKLGITVGAIGAVALIGTFIFKQSIHTQFGLQTVSIFNF